MKKYAFLYRNGKPKDGVSIEKTSVSSWKWQAYKITIKIAMIENDFITYLYKEHIRKNLECDNSYRLHYSLVFDLSPTLRQIASTLRFE